MAESPTTKELELRLEALDRLTTQLFAERDHATRLALENLEKRLGALNEIRAMAADQGNKLLPRDEYRVQHGELERRITTLESWEDKTEGKGLGLAAGWFYLVGLVGAIGVVWGVVMKYL